MLQYLKRVTDKKAQPISYEQFLELINDDKLQFIVAKARQCLAEGSKEGYQLGKGQLPAMQWVGFDSNPKDGLCERSASALQPTQYYMVDIDHMKMNPREAWQMIWDENRANIESGLYALRVVHVTPSGKGLRIVARAMTEQSAVIDHMDWLVRCLKLDEYGDYDRQCKDLSRLSYIVGAGDYMILDRRIFDGEEALPKPIKSAYHEQERPMAEEGVAENREAAEENDEEIEELRQTRYKGNLLTDIVDAWVKKQGEPERGEVHNYYNQMVKYFRNLCDNNPKVLHAVLPRFGHTAEETWSQCKTICRSNTMSKLPREFFFFLLDNGYYPKREDRQLSKTELEKIANEEVDSVQTTLEELELPKLPPVFREFCSVCPPDFILPTINAIIPVLGTLTSYLRADYMDGAEQSTTFFNVIYAPPGSGKSYVQRIIQPLFSKLHARDDISALREQMFLTEINRKGGNDKAPADPHVSVRIMPPINSQPEFLQKMRDNKGYHMFTFAEEVDTFNKGSKAAGGDKSDLFRVAWDNSEYGQMFKGANTFKGQVRLYYNILLTGTPAQVKNYYRNVENGMVSRVSFCEIKNQEFSKFPVWKKLNQRQKDIIQKVVDRCDEMTYRERLDFSVDEAYSMDEEQFKKSKPWEYNFRPFQYVDMSWIFSALAKWVDDKGTEASLRQDFAMDMFRRRKALVGFRIALMCTALWNKIGEKEKKLITDFVLWYIERDLQASLELFGQKYNETFNDAIANGPTQQPDLYSVLPEDFTKEDLYIHCKKMGIRTPLKSIVFKWKRDGAIKAVSKGKYKKMKNAK